jgi:hypothetical protein
MDAVTEENGSTENSTARAPTSQAPDTKSTANGKMAKELDGLVEENKTEKMLKKIPNLIKAIIYIEIHKS